jgi:hypothetical protein
MTGPDLAGVVSGTSLSQLDIQGSGPDIYALWHYEPCLQAR